MTSTTDRPVTPWPTRREREDGPAAARTAVVERAYVPRHAAADPELTERLPIVVPAQRSAGPRPSPGPCPPRPVVGSAVHRVRPDGRPLRNGMGVAAACLGALALPFGLVPVTGFLAAGLGVLATAFGIAGWSRVRAGAASNRGTAVTGAVLGLIALGLGVAGTLAFVSAPDRLVYDLEALTSPAATAVTPSGE